MRRRHRALIVDDERLARKELSSLLQNHENVQIVGEAESVKAAVEAARRLKPDVIFLDIQMPGHSGFEVLEQLEATPHIVFVTAYDEYALRAFDVNALDYLLKPVNPARLAKAITRIESAEEAKPSVVRKLTYPDVLFIRVGNCMKFLKISDIVYVKAAGDYSEVATSSGKTELVSKTMGEWEERLPDKNFCRIHRSAIINMEYVDRLEELPNYKYEVYMKNVKRPLEVSRRCAAMLKRRFA
ncbi:MAG: response regulator [Candidatus Eisenbacteria bacterium]